MKVLVIGSGGREHAIVWKLKQSPIVSELYCSPGNAGISELAVCLNIKADDIKGLLDFAKSNKIDLTVVGPEIPLEKGITDIFEENNLKIFGPAKFAAKLEHSKIFAKNFMKKYNIPTAEYKVFSKDEYSETADYLDSVSYPVVIKADGLAAGKGVVIAEDKKDALKTIENFFINKIFGASGESIVIEQFLQGYEASVFAVCDGENYIVLPSSQDHKKIGEGETGKNTGGMGAYSPADKTVTPYVLEKVKHEIIEPVLNNMKNQGNEFKGCLYCGLMIDKNQNPFVIEFNTRFGDPETQAVIPKIESDFAELLLYSAEGKLSGYNLKVNNNYYCTVVLASAGYPDKFETGKEITGLEKVTDSCIIFHAGTKELNGKIYSNGGRVLNVTGYSDKNLKEAINIAYQNSEIINFENKYYRKDIGKKGL